MLTKYENMMVNRIVTLRKTKIYGAIQRTMVLLYPFVIFGAVMTMIRSTTFVKGGFFDSLFKTTSWIPHISGISFFLGALARMSVGFAAVIAAYGVARFLAEEFQRDEQLAGITAIIGFMTLNFYNVEDGIVGFETAGIGFSSLFFGIVAGVITALIFKLIGRKKEPEIFHTAQILQRIFHSIWAIFVTITFFGIANMLFYLFMDKALSSSINTWVYSSLSNVHNFFGLLVLVFVSIFLQYIGIGSPLNPTQFAGSDTMANIDAALKSKSAWNVPYPVNGHSIIGIYTNIGGVGSTLALLIAILLISRRRNTQMIAQQAILPGFFNFNQPVLVGIPLIFNLTYLLPFLLAPIINMSLAVAALNLHWIPAAVYPIPTATPGILASFIGTNGNINALVFSLILLTIDVLIYLPFVRAAERVADLLDEERGQKNDVKN